MLKIMCIQSSQLHATFVEYIYFRCKGAMLTMMPVVITHRDEARGQWSHT